MLNSISYKKLHTGLEEGLAGSVPALRISFFGLMIVIVTGLWFCGKAVSGLERILCRVLLTLSQTTNFRLFQTERVCRRQFSFG